VRRFIVALVMAIPGAMRIVVPDTGHLMYIENLDECFKLVSSFLIAHGSQKTPPRSGSRRRRIFGMGIAPRASVEPARESQV
jgi:hypothetical protein